MRVRRCKHTCNPDNRPCKHAHQRSVVILAGLTHVKEFGAEGFCGRMFRDLGVVYVDEKTQQVFFVFLENV